MEWGKYVEMVGVQKTPKLTVSWKLPQGDGEKKEQIVKLTLKLVWSVQHAAEAIGSVRKKVMKERKRKNFLLFTQISLFFFRKILYREKE